MIRTMNYQNLIVGSGAAGFAAAERLHRLGIRDLALVTEGRMMGTSRNTGSDKQTYYKLTLSGDAPDSVTEMAETLFAGKSVDGDLALAEAAGSAPAFLHLAELGVPFPTNSYGEYVGYKTDHDPRSRATSAGPLTSKLMTEALDAAVQEAGITVLDGFQMIRILAEPDGVRGILCLELASGEPVLIRCATLVLATGGPACLYQDSVYPASQHGCTGIAFQAGIAGRNLTEWQYGLASVRPRWNVSGTYMQALPRFISTAADGSDPRDFLPEGFPDRTEMLGQIFLKGYQWPFDSRKAADGSSRIDLMVYRETVLKGRRVFLDFRSNPDGRTISFANLPPEAAEYLGHVLSEEDLASTPYARLAAMNQPAIDFYRSKGVDLETEPLEIALCAQHNNGGFAVDAWWRTNVPGIFAIGEAAGTHGVYRPGGTALNAGQVGALRATRYIAIRRRQAEILPMDDVCNTQLEDTLAMIASLRSSEDNTSTLTAEWRKKMSADAGAFRSSDRMREDLAELDGLLVHFSEKVGCADTARGIANAFRLYDQLLTAKVYLQAMLDFAGRAGCSRGSALYDHTSGALPVLAIDPIPEQFRFVPDDSALDQLVQEIFPTAQGSSLSSEIRWRPVHALPDRSSDFFENVWKSYRENGNVSDLSV